jgi:hypothetical protein
MEDIFNGSKKLGFGLMRLPLLNQNEASSIDIELRKWLIHLLKKVLPILTQRGCIVALRVKM